MKEHCLCVNVFVTFNETFTPNDAWLKVPFLIKSSTLITRVMWSAGQNILVHNFLSHHLLKNLCIQS